MKLTRIMIILSVVILVAAIGFLILMVHTRITGNEYQFQVDAVLAAAEIANGGEITDDPDISVIAEYEGKRYAVAPGNYLALSSYLRKDCVLLPFTKISRENALTITVCDVAVFRAVRDHGDSEDVVLVELETGGKTFTMRTDGGNQWKSLLTCVTEGTYHDRNLPLDP